MKVLIRKHSSVLSVVVKGQPKALVVGNKRALVMLYWVPQYKGVNEIIKIAWR